MEPAKLDDRELGCIDFFLFCFLLSSGLVWPPSWAILAPSWAILASSWAILAPSGAIRAPSWAPKSFPIFPRLNQTVPRGAHRPPEAPRAKIMKIWARRLAPFWGLNVMRVYHLHERDPSWKKSDSPLAKSILWRYEQLFYVVLSCSMMVNSIGFLHFSIFCEKTAYRAGRIQVQGTPKIDVFSHVKYRETLAKTRFWAVLWRLARFSRLLAQPLRWNDKTRSFRNASSRSEIHFFLQKVRSSVRMPLANSFSHL